MHEDWIMRHLFRRDGRGVRKDNERLPSIEGSCSSPTNRSRWR